MYIKVKAVTSSRVETVTWLKSDEVRITVREPAENNHANHRMLELVRMIYPGKSVRIVSGHHSPSKIFAID